MDTDEAVMVEESSFLSEFCILTPEKYKILKNHLEII
jgi:hypothetical protein